MTPGPIELTYAGTDAEPGVGITAYGLLLWPPGEDEPVKIADGLTHDLARQLAAGPAAVVALKNLLWQWDTHGTLMGLALQDARAAIVRTALAAAKAGR